jgi:cytochrome c peroxidase
MKYSNRKEKFFSTPLMIYLLLFAGGFSCLVACEPDEPVDAKDLINIPYQPQSYQLNTPTNWGIPNIPADNPLTVEGIELGRRLFYDPILSRDSTISCGHCHNINGSFTDNKSVSDGIEGRVGKRSAMALVNLAFVREGFFWDGRAASLEDQALQPIEDHLEMDENWDNAIKKIVRHKDYPTRFRKAFGISGSREITKQLAVKAIAQFERSIVSKDAKYDLFKAGKVELTDDEEIGRIMYDNIAPQYPDAQCGHCHSLVSGQFASNQFVNNGLQAATTLDDFKDNGLGKITKEKNDNGKMRTVTLRNIALSAPYMHDGSLKTLEEVINHYSSGGKKSPNKDPQVLDIKLNNVQKKQLVAFLNTLTDTVFINNPAYKNPFK